MKNKKMAIIILILLFIIIIGTIIGILVVKNTKSTENKSEINSKISEIYNNIEQATDITFLRKVDEDNQVLTVIKGDKAYKEITINGKKTKYIVKDGNTYFLNDSTKKYYEYQNNTTILSEIKLELSKLTETSNVKGKEKIDGKNYNYEEFSGYQNFLVNSNLMQDTANTKTRIYYEDEEIVFIKTIINNEEELSKVKLKYSEVSDNYFEIPKEYEKE